MNFSSKAVESAVNELSKLPGVGKKTALRLVIYLLKSEESYVNKLGDSIMKLKTDVVFCSVCGNISEGSVCNICASVNRDQTVICVVKDFQDIIAIENTGQYNGVYHVLGGVISPLDGIGPDDLSISGLIERIVNQLVTEVILALSANMEGDTTAFYISKLLMPLKVRISAISRGISVGGELEYADEITLGRSIKDRVNYNA
jgi:recombination protein RecR